MLHGRILYAGRPHARIVSIDVSAAKALPGVRAVLTDRDRFRSLKAGLYLLSTLKKLYPETFDLSRIDRWIGRSDVKDRLARGEAVESIMDDWQGELEEFLKVRQKYLIYPQ